MRARWLVGLVACGCHGGSLPIDDDPIDTDPADTDVEACVGLDRGCAILGELDLADAPTIVLGNPGDGMGALAIGDFDGDAVTDLAVGAPRRDESGAAAVFLGIPAGTVWIDDADVQIAPSKPGMTGYALGAADVDGDGQDDLLVGNVEGPGLVHLVAGPLAAGTVDPTASPTIVGTEGGGLFGSSFAVCDVDGDGDDDAWIGAVGVDSEAGATYLFEGPIAGGTAAAVVASVRGGAHLDRVGHPTVCAPDLDGDGGPEVLIGAPGYPGDNRGAVGVVSSSDPVGPATALDAVGALVAPAGVEQLGTGVGAPDDASGGIAFAAGAPLWTTDAGVARAGRLAVFATLPDGSADELATAVIAGDVADGLLGQRVAVGDLDGDGHSDVVVTHPGDHQMSSAPDGRIYVYYGPLSGALGPSDADAVLLAHNALAFSSVLDLADLDDDGFDDLVIGAQNGALPSHSHHGAVFVVWGAAR